MFSSNVHSLRQRVLREVLSPGQESHNIGQQNRKPSLGNERDELDDIFETVAGPVETILDPDKLPGADQAAYYDLEELENQLQIYVSSPFNSSILCFSSGTTAIPTYLPNLDAVLELLPAAHPTTQQLRHYIQGLQQLTIEIRSTECIHPILVAQKDMLEKATEIELEKLLGSLQAVHSVQVARTHHGHDIRFVDPGERSLHIYSSPLATSVIILTAIIHCLMGVGREACGFILVAFQAILTLAAEFQGARAPSFMVQHIREIPSTLPIALARLNLPPRLQYYVSCPECSNLYPQRIGVEIPTKCTSQNIDNQLCDRDLFTNEYRGGKYRKRPEQRYTHQLFEDWLGELLLRPGIENLIESTRPSLKQTMTDVWDAAYLCSFSTDGNGNFFEAPDNELRLCMLLFHDGFNPLGNSAGGKVRSVGSFNMICMNLPADIRYDTAYAYLTAVIPGPTEPSKEDLHHFVRPIADDMLEMYDPGIIIKTHNYPNGRRIRAVVPISSMDIPAARGFAGFAGHSHTCFCHLCTAVLSQIHHVNLDSFQLRSMDTHRTLAAEWASAPNSRSQEKLFKANGVRNSEWLRFQWWNAFAATVVGPMHWSKNILDKHLRRAMGWSWTLTTGIPGTPSLSRPISQLEYEWGVSVMQQCSASELEASQLPNTLLRYLCRQRSIFEAGISSVQLAKELNDWRVRAGILDDSGSVLSTPTQDDQTLVLPSIAKAHYNLSITTSAEQFGSKASRPELIGLCNLFQLSTSGYKADLAKRLFEYYANIRAPTIPETGITSSNAKKLVSVLGVEVLTEIHNDMGRTTLPQWFKLPPKNFAQVSHGKLQAEEYKSLAFVPFVITLVRLWGISPVGPYRERLDNFLHLMLAVRILAFQSLVESDILAFEHHYHIYLSQLAELYPYESRIPVQHLGLHLPGFLRALGPSTRYSESTCEMFNGLLQEISTNFKFGDLEVTMHREFIMATRLKGLIKDERLTKNLGSFGLLARKYLERRVPAQARTGWFTSHPAQTTTLDPTSAIQLNTWAKLRRTRNFATNLFKCSYIAQGNVEYAPCNNSAGNSCIMFCPDDNSHPRPGRIDFIYEESFEAIPANTRPRILLIVRPFASLSTKDSFQDPYRNHPLIGKDGAAIAQLYYDDVLNEAYVLEPRNIVSHIAVCNYHDPNCTIPRGCVVVLSLDLKHERYA